MDEPCNWPDSDCEQPEEVTSDQWTNALDEAVWTLWVMTGQRFGQCEVTLVTPPTCLCRLACTCMSCYIYLPGPAGDVSEVTENGVTLDDWSQQGTRIWRPLGWLGCGDIEVTYLRGVPVPPGGGRVVGELARHLALLACGSDKCQLPANWETRTRRGDTIRRQPVNGADQTSLTGLPGVDRWIATARRYGRQGKVWTPDVDGWILQAGPTVPS